MSGSMHVRQREWVRRMCSTLWTMRRFPWWGSISGESGEDRTGSDEGPEVVLWHQNSSPESFTFTRDGGPTGQVAGENQCEV